MFLLLVFFLDTVLPIIIAISLVTGLLFGYMCMKIMKKKGQKNPFLWFIVGFFTTWIGLIVCLVIQPTTPVNTYAPPPYPNQPYPNQPYAQPQGMRCQSCGMLNPPNAKHCIECGEKLY